MLPRSGHSEYLLPVREVRIWGNFSYIRALLPRLNLLGIFCREYLPSAPWHLGKGEVDSSILSGSTIKSLDNPHRLVWPLRTSLRTNRALFSAFRHNYFAVRSCPSP